MRTRRMGTGWVSIATAACAVVASPGEARAVGAFEIQINPGTTLAGNPEALAAFGRAAAIWESFLSDPVTVSIDADLASLPAGVLGSAANPLVGGSYDLIRNQIVSDALGESDDGIVASLPTAAQFTADLPAGVALGGQLLLTKANAKALGFGVPGGPDSTITFGTGFSFDYDNSDGVSPGTIDFETVAAHEIGHALGFTSAVDNLNQFPPPGGITTAFPNVLDLFRFDTSGAGDPSTPVEFTAFSRSLTPGVAASFDDVTDAWAMSTGQDLGHYVGTDGRQAAHWKDNALTGSLLGIMDPTLPVGSTYTITRADLRALDLIGWEIVLDTVGDYDADRLVGQGDLSLVLQHWGQTASPGGPPDPAWLLDDQILGGRIDQDELSRVLQHWGDTATLAAAVAQAEGVTGLDYSHLIQAVPEPASASAFVLFAAWLGLRRGPGDS